MANRYWVGGTGTWNTTSTTNWSASSGGAGGASVPTATDSVFFDQAGTYAVTITGTLRCLDFTVSAGAVTFTTGTSPVFNISGNLTWTAGTVAFSGSAPGFTFTGAGTKTITTNGVAFPSGGPATQFNTGTFNLGSALTGPNLTFTITPSAATLNTNNYALSVGGFFGTGTMNWGSSTVTASGGTIFNASSNFTLNAGTSQLNCTAATVTLNATGTPALTYNNVAFTLVGSAATITINNANTFNTLSFVGRTNTGVNRVTFTANQTISTLTLNAGTAAAYRTMLQSDTIGTPRTLAVTTLTAGAADYDFRDIIITGAAAPLSVTRAGDCKGNSGITFPAAKTVYYRQTGSANWGATGSGSWSLTSGGALDATAFPLPQDTAVFPAATYPASGSTTTIPSNYNIGTIDMSLRTANTMTLATTTGTLTIYGNWINGTGITLSGTSVMTFCGRASQTITSAGKTFTQAFTIDTPSGSVTLQDALAASQSSSSVLTLTKGTFDAATFNVTLSGALAGVNASGTGIRTIAIGSGTWSIAGTTGAWNASTSTNLTVTGTGTISLTSTSAKTFNGGGIQTYPTLNQGGTGALTVSGSNKFANITNTAIGSVLFTSGTTNEFLAFNLNGALGNLLTLGATTTSQATLKKPTTWYMGANSIDAGNNTNLVFTAGGGIDYLSVSYINGVLTAVLYNATIIEAATGTDSISAGFLYLGTISELSTGTDTVSSVPTYLGVVSESGTGSDIISAQSALGAAILESATLADTNLARLIALATIAESATITDLIDAIKGYFVYILESAAASDAIAARQTINLTISEAAAAADIVQAYFVAAAQVTELATGSDQISALRALAAAVVETATLTDSVSARAVFLGLLQEAATAQDAVNAPGSTYNILMQELAQAQDALTTTAVFPVSLSETATGTQTNSAAFIPLATITESATITDVASALQAFAASISETSAAADSVLVAPSIFNAIAVASATALDNLNAPGSIYNVTVPESATLSDSVIGAFLWNLIDDSQSVNWQNVVDAQSVTWSAIANNQTAGWSDVNNSQPTSWTNIDDDQDPDWEDIPTLN